MYTDGKIWLGQSADKNIYLLPQMANRHGLISGATGTGKTITMKVLAESFSAMGVPVFFSDVKGDLSGMCRPGADSDSMRARIASFGIDNFPIYSLSDPLLGYLWRAGASRAHYGIQHGSDAAGAAAEADRYPGGRA